MTKKVGDPTGDAGERRWSNGCGIKATDGSGLMRDSLRGFIEFVSIFGRLFGIESSFKFWHDSSIEITITWLVQISHASLR